MIRNSLLLALGLASMPALADDARTALVIHAGAGVIERRALSAEDERAVRRDLDRALDALEGAGFEPPEEAERRFWRESYYNLPVRAPEGGALVEMHWSIAQETRQRPDIGGLFARSRAAEWKGRTPNDT